eukprot:1143694-Pelagomonas_calceolata.AAC.6
MPKGGAVCHTNLPSCQSQHCVFDCTLCAHSPVQLWTCVLHHCATMVLLCALPSCAPVCRFNPAPYCVLPRQCQKDVMLGGWHIPKGSTVWIPLHSVHNSIHNFTAPEVCGGLTAFFFCTLHPEDHAPRGATECLIFTSTHTHMCTQQRACTHKSSTECGSAYCHATPTLERTAERRNTANQCRTEHFRGFRVAQKAANCMCGLP